MTAGGRRSRVSYPDDCETTPVCLEAPSVETIFLRLDTMHPVMGDIRIGEAIGLAVDKESLVEQIFMATALRELPDEQRGWLAEKRSVQCQSCKAVSVFDPDRVGQNCDFCGSPSLVPYDEIKAPIRPESLLPFKVTEAQVREQIRRWYASKWLAPNKLKARARRSGARRLHPLLDLRRPRRLSVARGRRALLLHDRDLPRQSGPPADPPGPARALGTGRRRGPALLRRRSRSRERRACRRRC